MCSQIFESRSVWPAKQWPDTVSDGQSDKNAFRSMSAAVRLQKETNQLVKTWIASPVDPSLEN